MEHFSNNKQLFTWFSILVKKIPKVVQGKCLFKYVTWGKMNYTIFKEPLV